MNILDKIVLRKQEEIADSKKLISISTLEKEALFQRETTSLTTSLRGVQLPGIISEFKRKSPSKGVINGISEPDIVTADYVSAGAVALSVLTDTDFFGGSFDDFKKARLANPAIPMLRKDFMVDEYQVYEAKAIGADLILLIAACLSPQQVKSLATLAHQLGMEVLLEVHNLEELQETLCDEIDIVGVNNRNLKTFETSIETSLALSEHIPDSFVKISESGLQEPQTILDLYKTGYTGFLIGETFMKTANPGAALTGLQKELYQACNPNPLLL